MPATDSIPAPVAVRGGAVDAGVAAASTTTVGCRFADVDDPERLVGSLTTKFGAVSDLWCGASGVGTAAVTTGVSGVGGNAAAGDLAGAAAASAADVVLSLVDGLERVCAPPELCTTPERGSGVQASLGEGVEPT